MRKRLPKLPAFLRVGPVTRISFGLISLAACLLLTVDLVLGVLPDDATVARQIRRRSSESLAVQLAALAQTDQSDAIRRTLHAVVTRDPDVISIALRRADGAIAAETGNHARLWTPPSASKSTLTSVVVPISTNEGLWGQLEIAYRPATPQTLKDWLKYPSVVLTGTMMTVGFLMFYLYLRRILQHLDPNAAIPDRVRTAFDALSEGVLVIDKQGQIVLANSSFRALHPQANRDLTGKKIEELDWLVQAVGNVTANWPWVRAMKTRTTVTGEMVKIERPDDSPMQVTLNCAPIVDDREGVRGCLITLDDLTMVEHMNQQLLEMIGKLEAAKNKIEGQNKELKHLADHDQLTDALTRRSFLQRAQEQFLKAAAQGGNVACIMVDIDHFKSINDRYGHLVGDQVIHHVAHTLHDMAPRGGHVCRYGGEEFCVQVPDLNSRQAQQFADTLRASIEATCGATVIPGESVRITASFGVSALEHGATTLTEMINQADQALYLSKHSGRNRVSRYDEVTAKQSGTLATA